MGLIFWLGVLVGAPIGILAGIAYGVIIIVRELRALRSVAEDAADTLRLVEHGLDADSPQALAEMRRRVRADGLAFGIPAPYLENSEPERARYEAHAEWWGGPRKP